MKEFPLIGAALRRRMGLADHLGTKPTLTFVPAFSLSFAALIAVQAARSQLKQAACSWQTGADQLGQSQLHLGTFLVYAAWILALGGAEFLWQARHCRRPELSWAGAVLLGAFLYLSLVP